MNTSMQKVTVPVPVAEFPGGAEAARRGTERRHKRYQWVAGTYAGAYLVAGMALVFGVGPRTLDDAAWETLRVAALATAVAAGAFLGLWVGNRARPREVAVAPESETAAYDALTAAGVPGAVAVAAARLADDDPAALDPPWPTMNRRLIDGGEVVYRASAKVVGPRIVDVGGPAAQMIVTWEEKR